MLKTLWLFVNETKVRPETTKAGQRGEHHDGSSSSSPPRNEGAAAYASTCAGTSVVNVHVHVVQIDSSTSLEGHGPIREESRECYASANCPQDSDWVEIDLGVQDVHTNGTEHYGEDDQTKENGPTEMTFSSSNVHRVLSLEKPEAMVSSRTLGPVETKSTQQQSQNATKAQTFPGVQQSGVEDRDGDDHRTAQEAGHFHTSNSAIPRTVSTFSSESLTEYCRSVILLFLPTVVGARYFRMF